MSYAELAPHLALRVQALAAACAQGEYAQHPLDDMLILGFHHRICGDLVPDWSGVWRSTPVEVGTHVPPAPWQVPGLMRDYGLDLQARVAGFDGRLDDQLLECLAFAEGRLLSVHPFRDFNGRVTRVFLGELLRRLELPDAEVSPAPGEPTRRYLEALRAGDRGDWGPLMAVWRERLAHAFDE